VDPVATAGVAHTSSDQSLLWDMRLSQVPSMSELAFTSPQNLPARLGSGHASNNVPFGFHNVSEEGMRGV
jgi:hypothetical protein